MPLPVTQANIMDYTSQFELDDDPGTHYAYSNYGYMLLGKVIEEVTGLPYDTYVRQNVLSPVGIQRMVLSPHRAEPAAADGGDLLLAVHRDDRARLLRRPRALPVRRLQPGEHGGARGWLSSAVDMAKFTTIFDAPGLLTSSSIAQAFAEPDIVNPDGWYYGLGWLVRPVTGGLNTWHDGSLPGTSTLMVRRWDGLSWVVLFNQRDDPSGLG